MFSGRVAVGFGMSARDGLLLRRAVVLWLGRIRASGMPVLRGALILPLEQHRVDNAKLSKNCGVAWMGGSLSSSKKFAAALPVLAYCEHCSSSACYKASSPYIQSVLASAGQLRADYIVT